jgi:hypothetical protein
MIKEGGDARRVQYKRFRMCRHGVRIAISKIGVDVEIKARGLPWLACSHMWWISGSCA